MALVKQGSTTLNAGAKGDKGDTGTSGGSNGNITPVTSLAELLDSGVGDILDIQAPITLLANYQIPSGQQWRFSTGYVDIDTFELDLNGASLNFNSKLKGLDLSSGTVIGDVTLLNDIVYASNIGALDNDTFDNTTTFDNWKAIFNALHIVNQNGATLKFNRQTATGTYFIKVYDDTEGSAFFTDGFGNDKTLIIGNRNYGDSYDNIEISSESGVKIRTFADDSHASSVFSLYNTKNSKILNNHFIGDRDSHFYDQRLRIGNDLGATSNGVLDLRILEFDDYKDTVVTKTVSVSVNISIGTAQEVAAEIVSNLTADAAFSAAGYIARVASESETPTTDTDQRVIIRGIAGTYMGTRADSDTSGANVTADSMLYEWGHCIVQDSRAVNCEIGNNIIEQYHGDGIAKNEQGNGTQSLDFEDFTNGNIDEFGTATNGDNGYYYLTTARDMPSPHDWFTLINQPGQSVKLLHFKYWMAYYEDDGVTFIEKSPTLSPFDLYKYPSKFKKYKIIIEDYGTDLYEPLIGEFNITSGSNDLTSTTFIFESEDEGKRIIVVGAGAGGSDLETTINKFTNANTIELGANASTTVTNADGQLNQFTYFINSPSIPEGGLIHHNEFIENRRHGVTNVLNNQVVEHNKFYRNSGVAPEIDLNIEDWGKRVNGQVVRFNEFTVTNIANMSLKGCNRVEVYGNKFIQGSHQLKEGDYDSIPPAILVSFARNLQIHSNFFENRLSYVDLITNSYKNHYTNSRLEVRNGNAIVDGEIFINSFFGDGISMSGVETEGTGGDGISTVKNCVFYINDDWGDFDFISEANSIRHENNKYYFNDKVSQHYDITDSNLRDVKWRWDKYNRMRAENSTTNDGKHEGSYNGVEVYGAKVDEAALHLLGWAQYAANTKNFYLESSLKIQNGYEKSFKIKDGEINGWFWLELGEYGDSGVGDFETITIENVDVIVPPEINAETGHLVNTSSQAVSYKNTNLLRVTQNKNVNLIFKNCSFISKDTATGLFMYLGNRGTTDFIGCTFDAPQAENIDFTVEGAEKTIGVYRGANTGVISIKDAITPSNRISFTLRAGDILDGVEEPPVELPTSARFIMLGDSIAEDIYIDTATVKSKIEAAYEGVTATVFEEGTNNQRYTQIEPLLSGILDTYTAGDVVGVPTYVVVNYGTNELILEAGFRPYATVNQTKLTNTLAAMDSVVSQIEGRGYIPIINEIYFGDFTGTTYTTEEDGALPFNVNVWHPKCTQHSPDFTYPDGTSFYQGYNMYYNNVNTWFLDTVHPNSTGVAGFQDHFVATICKKIFTGVDPIKVAKV